MDVFRKIYEENQGFLGAYEGISGGVGEKLCEYKPNVAMAVFMILIVIIGLFGNAVVFYVILVLKEYKKSVSNWYILQLALADTLFLLMLPFSASSELVGKWEFPLSLCKAKEGILFVNYYASIFFLTIMSFDRYMAVTKSGVSPWADVLRRIDSASLISLVTWFVSICLCIPIFLYSKVNECKICSYKFPLTKDERCKEAGINATACDGWIAFEDSLPIHETIYHDSENRTYNYDYDDFGNYGVNESLTNYTEERLREFGQHVEAFNLTQDGNCKDDGVYYHAWMYLNFSMMLVLPFVLICAFYGMILHTMMGTGATASTNQKHYRRRVTLMVFALVSLFAISWVPWYAVQLARIRGFNLASNNACEAMSNFTRIMSYLNSALNPYFYSFMGSRFRQRLTRARSTSTRKSRFISVLSRISLHGHDPNSSTSGTGKSPHCSSDKKVKYVKGHSDDESSNAKTNVRTERTVIDTAIVNEEKKA